MPSGSWRPSHEPQTSGTSRGRQADAQELTEHKQSGHAGIDNEHNKGEGDDGHEGDGEGEDEDEIEDDGGDNGAASTSQQTANVGDPSDGLTPQQRRKAKERAKAKAKKEATKQDWSRRSGKKH